VRGTVGLPNGLAKPFGCGDCWRRKSSEAQKRARICGRRRRGAENHEGWTDFDAVIATPDMMRSAGKLGKVLGPRLMPTKDRHGHLRSRQGDQGSEGRQSGVSRRQSGIVHCPIGKIQFDGAKLAENAQA